MNFCPACGHRLTAPDAAFCDACGTGLTAGGRRAEHRFGVVNDFAVARAVCAALELPLTERTVISADQMTSLCGNFTVAATDMTDLVGLQHAVNIDGLTLDAGPDISALLKSISSGTGLPKPSAVTSLEPLAGLTNLSTLTLRHLPFVSDLGALTGLSSLAALNIDGLTNVTTLGPVAGLRALNTLTLTALPKVSDLHPLAGLPALSTLTLSALAKVGDLGPLAGLPELTTLTLMALHIDVDLSPLVNLPSLTALCLALNPVDVGPLADTTSLSVLVFIGKNLRIAGLAALPLRISVRYI